MNPGYQTRLGFTKQYEVYNWKYRPPFCSSSKSPQKREDSDRENFSLLLNPKITRSKCHFRLEILSGGLNAYMHAYPENLPIFQIKRNIPFNFKMMPSLARQFHPDFIAKVNIFHYLPINIPK